MLAAIVLLVVPVCVNSNKDIIYNEEKVIYDNIMQHYNKLFRPYKQTTVDFALALSAIVEVNEKEGHLTTTHTPKISWHDPRLMWNVSADNDIRHLQIPCTELWKPDIEVLNRYKDLVHDVAMMPLCWVHWDGEISFVLRQTYQTPCSFDLAKFPFDIQSCLVHMGSWAYLTSEVDIQLEKNGTESKFYVGHTDWKMSSFTIARKEEYYGQNVSPFTELIINITLTRKPKYFYYMFLLPADIVAWMLPVLHFIPPNKDSKIMLLSALVICSTIMLNSLEDFMPAYATDQPPTALKIYSAILMGALFSSAITCLCLAIGNPETKSRRIPIFIRKILSTKLTYVCCLCTDKSRQNYHLLNLEKNLLQHEESLSNSEMSDTNTSSQMGNSTIVSSLQLLVEELQIARYREEMKLEWLLFSQLIDRLAGIIFIIVAFIISATSHSSL